MSEYVLLNSETGRCRLLSHFHWISMDDYAIHIFRTYLIYKESKHVSPLNQKKSPHWSSLEIVCYEVICSRFTGVPDFLEIMKHPLHNLKKICKTRGIFWWYCMQYSNTLLQWKSLKNSVKNHKSVVLRTTRAHMIPLSPFSWSDIYISLL